MIVDLIIWNDDCDQCDVVGLAVHVAVRAAVVAVMLFVLAIAIRGLRRLVSGQGSVRPTRRLAAVAAVAGLVLVAPVQLGWNDGCNSHGATVMLAEAPRILITNPEWTFAGYEDYSTLKNCGS